MASIEARSRSNGATAVRSSGLLGFVIAVLSIACLPAIITGCSSPSLRSIAITPATGQTVLTATGQTAQFRAIGTYQQGNHPPTTQDITASVTWSTNTQTVAQISSPGLVMAIGPGTTTVTATTNGAFGVIQATSNVQVNLTSAPVTGLTAITIIPATQPITVIGQTAQFVAIGNYTGVTPSTQDLTRQATWSSSAPGIATITSGTSGGGIATAVSPGTATITATSNSANGAIVGTATITVTASAVTGLTAITIIPNTQVVYSTGETSQYIAIGTFTGTTPTTQDITDSPNLKWISSDVSVATISTAGLATETGFGTSAITAEWVETGTPAITGTATFTSQANGPATFPSLEVYKVGNGATTATATITPSPSSTQSPFSCGTGTGCTGYYFPLGTTVTLTVSPVPSDFGGFTSNCTPIAGNPVMSCTVTLNGNQAVGAIFN
jgi:trimeric autotransporter adhesin